MNNDSIKNDVDQKTLYEKSQSFNDFHGATGDISELKVRLKKILVEDNLDHNDKKTIIIKALEDCLSSETSPDKFNLFPNVISEMSRLTDTELPRYLYYRYRYDLFPKKFSIDAYPPLVQIEPASSCNFRCVFCYQTDASFTKKSNGHMGVMPLQLFKNIVDELEGNVDAVTLASRGEPTVCKDFGKMLEYMSGKFLATKVNTNASLLTEKVCHDLLSSDLQTLVFSADAADEELYAKLRVNGSLQKTLSNVRMFNTIKNQHYSTSKLITRVSGVKVNQSQNLDSMLECWGDLVDQVAFVSYNPWENTYERSLSDETRPCSDLWRRLFVWWDGRTNPCDVDYKTELCTGTFPNKSIKDIWNGEAYSTLRENHLNSKRNTHSPCNKCTVI